MYLKAKVELVQGKAERAGQIGAVAGFCLQRFIEGLKVLRREFNSSILFPPHSSLERTTLKAWPATDSNCDLAILQWHSRQHHEMQGTAQLHEVSQEVELSWNKTFKPGASMHMMN